MAQCPSVWSAVCLCVSMSVYMFVCLCLSVSLSVSLYVSRWFVSGRRKTGLASLCGDICCVSVSVCLYVSLYVSRWFVSGRRKASLASLCGDICYAVMTRRPRHGPRLANVASRSLDWPCRLTTYLLTYHTAETWHFISAAVAVASSHMTAS